RRRAAARPAQRRQGGPRGLRPRPQLHPPRGRRRDRAAVPDPPPLIPSVRFAPCQSRSRDLGFGAGPCALRPAWAVSLDPPPQARSDAGCHARSRRGPLDLTPLPEALRPAFGRAFDADPERRFACCGDLVEALGLDALAQLAPEEVVKLVDTGAWGKPQVA